MTISITGYGISNAVKVRKGFRPGVVRLEIVDDDNVSNRASISISLRQLLDALTVGMTEDTHVG